MLTPSSLFIMEYVYEVNESERILFTFIQKNSITVAPLKHKHVV